MVLLILSSLQKTQGEISSIHFNSVKPTEYKQNLSTIWQKMRFKNESAKHFQTCNIHYTIIDLNEVDMRIYQP